MNNTTQIETLRAIAENHSGEQTVASIKVQLREVITLLEDTSEEGVTRRIISEQVEAAINGSFANIIAAMDQRIVSLTRRMNEVEEYESRIEDLENGGDSETVSRINDLESRMDDVESYESRIDDLESSSRNDETHDNLNSLVESVQEQDEQISKAEARLEVLEVAQTMQRESVAQFGAVIDFIKGRLA